MPSRVDVTIFKSGEKEVKEIKQNQTCRKNGKATLDIGRYIKGRRNVGGRETQMESWNNLLERKSEKDPNKVAIC